MEKHFIVYCPICNAIVNQCRCPKPKDITRYEVCAKCREKQESETCDKIEDIWGLL